MQRFSNPAIIKVLGAGQAPLEGARGARVLPFAEVLAVPAPGMTRIDSRD